MRRPVYSSVYCVFSNFKHLLAEICEYFTLCRGQPCINVSLMFVFSGTFNAKLVYCRSMYHLKNIKRELRPAIVSGMITGDARTAIGYFCCRCP